MKLKKKLERAGLNCRIDCLTNTITLIINYGVKEIETLTELPKYYIYIALIVMVLLITISSASHSTRRIKKMLMKLKS